MDPCWLCQCRGGISFCSKAECAELDCENFYIPEGECCPVCIGILGVPRLSLTSSRFLMILVLEILVQLSVLIGSTNSVVARIKSPAAN